MKSTSSDTASDAERELAFLAQFGRSGTAVHSLACAWPINIEVGQQELDMLSEPLRLRFKPCLGFARSEPCHGGLVSKHYSDNGTSSNLFERCLLASRLSQTNAW
jgi:hypothetical protein